MLYTLMSLIDCVFPGEPRSQQRNGGANWRLEVRPATLLSVKVICTHNTERSLVFINSAGRIGPENQIKNCSGIVARGGVQVP